MVPPAFPSLISAQPADLASLGGKVCPSLCAAISIFARL